MARPALDATPQPSFCHTVTTNYNIETQTLWQAPTATIRDCETREGTVSSGRNFRQGRTPLPGRWRSLPKVRSPSGPGGRPQTRGAIDGPEHDRCQTGFREIRENRRRTILHIYARSPRDSPAGMSLGDRRYSSATTCARRRSPVHDGDHLCMTAITCAHLAITCAHPTPWYSTCS